MAYHWLYHGGVDAQASFCHGIVGGTPVMVDCEDTGNVPTVADCVAFAAALRARGGTCTLAYLPRWYWRDHLGSPSLTPLTSHGLRLVSSLFAPYSDTGPGWTPSRFRTPGRRGSRSAGCAGRPAAWTRPGTVRWALRSPERMAMALRRLAPPLETPGQPGTRPSRRTGHAGAAAAAQAAGARSPERWPRVDATSRS